MDQSLRAPTAFAWLIAATMTMGIVGCSRTEKAKPQPSKSAATPSKTTDQTAKPTAKPSAEESAQKSAAEPDAKPEMPHPEASASNLTGGTFSRSEMSEKPGDLGLPLVDNFDQLKELVAPVWLDPQNKQVVFLAEVCKADYPLEFFATYRDRSYEAIVATEARPSVVHAGLLALGAVPGRPARFQPEFVAPSGVEVAVEVRWKDAHGNLQSSPAQEWVRNIETKKAMDINWVFAGSGFVTDETTGRQHYMADGGEFICLLNLPTALLDVPIRSASALESRLFEAFLEHLPPTGTPVTILLKPKFKSKLELKPEANPETRPETKNDQGQSLMKMVDPKIILQGEEEEKLEVKQP